MSETVPTDPPPQPHSQPVPPRPRPAAGYYAPPPYPPYPPAYYQQPPARPSSGGRLFVYGLIFLAVLGMVGIGTLIGSVFLYAVATDALAEITLDRDEKTVTEKFIDGKREAKNKVVIITLDGIITNDADGFVAKQIRRVTSDETIKAVVLRVESPGGTMSGSDYYHYLLKAMKTERTIPIVVSMGSVAASGGYYVSMVGDEIYAEPSTITGSIGVIASLFDASELLKNIGIEPTSIVSGKHKAMGSFLKPISEEERALFQNLIDDNFERFKEIIREGRKGFRNNPAKLDELATGQIFSAKEARNNGLIDKIGFIDEAITSAGTLAKLSAGDYQVIQYKPKLSFMDSLFESRSPSSVLSGKTLSDVTSPKIYLICPYVIPVEK
jgi:protease-4